VYERKDKQKNKISYSMTGNSKCIQKIKGNPPRKLNEGFLKLYLLRYGYLDLDVFIVGIILEIIFLLFLYYNRSYILNLPPFRLTVLILAIMLILIPIIIGTWYGLFDNIRTVIRSKYLYENGIATTGKVIKITKHGKFIYEFKTKEGQVIRRTIILSYPQMIGGYMGIGGPVFEPTKEAIEKGQAICEGSEIVVLYDRNNPKINDVYELMRLGKKPGWWYYPPTG